MERRIRGPPLLRRLFVAKQSFSGNKARRFDRLTRLAQGQKPALGQDADRGDVGQFAPAFPAYRGGNSLTASLI